MARKTKKGKGKVIAGGLGLLLLLGALGGSGKDKADPAATEAPVRAVATDAAATPRPTVRPTATPSPEPTPTPYLIRGMDPQRTVYVSRSGVIHVEEDCSGMKHYTKMPLEKADAAGYEYCSKCVW